MPRKPKGQNPDVAKAGASWRRGTTDFDRIEQALGAPLGPAPRSAIEFSLAVAILGKSKHGAKAPSDMARESLDDIAITAVSLSSKITLSLKRGHAGNLHRFLLTGRRKWNLHRIADNLLELALAADVLTRAGRLATRRPPKGRPRSNDDWNVLVQDLAEVFRKVRRKKPGISFATGRPTGNFYDFVLAVFAEVPKTIRPSASALGPLIKIALKAPKPA